MTPYHSYVDMSCSKLLQEDSLPQRKRARVEMQQGPSLLDLPDEIICLIMMRAINNVWDYWKFTSPPKHVFYYLAYKLGLSIPLTTARHCDVCVSNSRLANIVLYLFSGQLKIFKDIWDQSRRSLRELIDLFRGILSIISATELLNNCPCDMGFTNPLMFSYRDPAKDAEIFEKNFSKVAYGFSEFFAMDNSLRLHVFMEVKRRMIYENGAFRHLMVIPKSAFRDDFFIVRQMDPMPTIFASCDGFRRRICRNSDEHFGSILSPLSCNRIVTTLPPIMQRFEDCAFFTTFYLSSCERCGNVISFCTKVKTSETFSIVDKNGFRTSSTRPVIKDLCMDCLLVVPHVHVSFFNSWS